MGRNWAVSIGINGYQFTSLAPLKYAKSDATLIADLFKKDAGFDQVWLFAEDSADIFGEPTIPYRTPLIRFFNKQFGSPFLTAKDSFWLFFSGHGLRRHGKDYLLPIDGDPDFLEETAISVDFIVQKLNQSGAGNTFIILDSCRTEGRKGQGIGESSYNGVTIIYSCKPYESSWEIGEPIFQGSFTYVLSKILRNQVGGSYLSVKQTEKILQEEILALNNNFGKLKQTPHICCESVQRGELSFLPPSLVAKEIGLGKVNPKKRTKTEKRLKKDWLSLKDEALKAEAAGQFTLAKDLWYELFLISPSQQESYSKAIKRIAEKEATLTYYSLEKEDIRNNVESSTSKSISKSGNNESLLLSLDAKNINPKQTYSFQFEFVSLDYEGKNIARSIGENQAFAEIINESFIEMVLIPSGSYFMGSSHKKAHPSELPAHLVKLNYSFMMSKYPITKKQWIEIAKLEKVNQDLPIRPYLKGGKNHPAVNVSWHEAVEFCNRLTHKTRRAYRLPTEAEWEYACRAETTSLFHFGDSINSSLANFEAQSLEPVGKFPFANRYGLFDMHGSVWEWCQDNWHESYLGAPTDGTAWLDSEANQSRLLRGGSWRNEFGLCRSASRMFDDASTKSNNIGFRVVCFL